MSRTPTTERAAAELDDDYLTTAETAALLRCSVSFLKHARLRGEGPPCIQLGVKRLYRRRDIEAWADAQTKAHGA